MIPVGTPVLVACYGGTLAGTISEHAAEERYFVKFKKPSAGDNLYRYSAQDLTVIDPTQYDRTKA